MQRRLPIVLGWSELPDRPACNSVPSGQQRCFRTPERELAISYGCVPAGINCQTTDGNPGAVWCCPSGWPRPVGASAIAPDIKPPIPPFVGVMSIFAGDWWFWLGAVSASAFAYFTYENRKRKKEEAIEELMVWRGR